VFSVPEPYLIFGNRYYIHRMKIDGSNYTRIPRLVSFVQGIDIDDKVTRRTAPVSIVSICKAPLNDVRWRRTTVARYHDKVHETMSKNANV